MRFTRAFAVTAALLVAQSAVARADQARAAPAPPGYPADLPYLPAPELYPTAPAEARSHELCAHVEIYYPGYTHRALETEFRKLLQKNGWHLKIRGAKRHASATAVRGKQRIAVRFAKVDNGAKLTVINCDVLTK